MPNPPPVLLAVLLLAACACASPADIPPDLKSALERDCATPKSWTLRPDLDCSRRAVPPPGKTWDLRGCSALSVRALRTDRTHGGLRLRWLLHSRTGGIYQAAHATAVSSAAHSDVRLSLRPDQAGLVPQGHQRPWDELAAAEITAIELRAECSFAASGREPLVLALTPPEWFALNAASQKTELIALRVLPPAPGSRAEAQLTFRLEPMPADPFAAEGAGDVRVHGPDGSVALAFIDQDFAARDDGSRAAALPAGAPYFRAALPAFPTHGTFKIRSGEQSWPLDAAALHALREASLPATPPLPPGRWTPSLRAAILENPPHGLPRVCSSLRALGRFEPVSRAVPEGPCWRPVPFWSAEWGGFSDALQPNLELAARMDRMLAAAAHAGETHPLLLFDGATLGREGPFNWLSHPARDQVSGPGELYRSPAGEQFLRRWMRYALARWGHSRAVDEAWIGLESLAPGDAAFFTRLAPHLAQWSGARLPLFALHPFASESSAQRTVATFDGSDAVHWFADIRQGASHGGRALAGSDGPHAFELRARTASELTIGLTADFSRIHTVWNQTAPDNFSSGDTLLFDIQLPAAAPPDLRLGIHLRDRDGLWYQALLPGMPHPGDWATLALDLSARNAHGLAPVGHAKPWTGYSRQRLTEIGLHLYSTHSNWTPQAGGLPQPLRATIDHIRLLQRPGLPAAPAALTVLNQRVLRAGTTPLDPGEAAVGDLYECDVNINRVFENPFDPTHCDLSASISLPSGKTVRVPLFFNQPCERKEDGPGGDEIVAVRGAEHFTLRYRIVESGAHRVAYELREGGRYDVTQRDWVADNRFTPDGRGQAPVGRARWGQTNYPERSEAGRRAVESVRFVPGAVSVKLETPGPAFVARKPAKPFKGFVRAAADKRHFEFDDGSFYYALGPCVRSPSDHRIAYLSEKWSPDEIERLGRRGTYQYDDYFAAYEKAGINWARVWMCPWWGALEWRRDWPGYQGVGRYNLLNAWRFDHLLAEAERRGIYLSLCLTNHGQYSLHVDSEWVNNPYSARLGGPLIAASEFFSRGDAKILHQNKLRYIVARFGHSPAIASWALFSELEWTEEYEPSLRFDGVDAPAPILNRWHTEMAEFLKEQDLNDHLTLTHYSHPTHGESTLALPAIDIAASNAYSAFQEFGPGRFDASFALASYWAGYPEGNLRGMSHLKKPILVEEQGRHWMGGRNNTELTLNADLHAQLWGGVVQPLAGATGYWWWVQLHLDNRYSEYAALARYVKAEDFRPMKGESALEPAYRSVPAQGGELYARALKSNRRLYAWIYHPNMPLGRETALRSNGEVRVGGLEPGAYVLEFWDTTRGECIESRDLTVALENGKPQSITFKLPPVHSDMALKLKPK